MKTILRVESDRYDFIKKVMALKLNKPFSAEVKLYRKPRSLSQLKLYWVWLGAVEKETENDKNYMHEYFKKKYLPKLKVDIFGEITLVLPSTKRLTTDVMKIYMDKVFLECAENGIELKTPDDYHFDKFVEHYSERF